MKGTSLPDCLELKRNGAGDVVIHLDVGISLKECFTPYFKKPEINGIKQNLWDSGLNLNIIGLIMTI